ncbi:hypothetical protein BC828DRAFT_402667 [Blastocladiella britannica]|nr:hypothetical protein BC828DRAFT_402667 [Blastocladiella britannica]
MPRDSRHAARKPTTTATFTTTTSSSSAVEKPTPSWFRAFLDGVGRGIGKAVGGAIGKLLVASLTAATSYIMYKTPYGYRAALLVAPQEKVDSIIYRSRLTGRVVMGTTALISVAYVSLKTVRAGVWVAERFGFMQQPRRSLPPPPSPPSASTPGEQQVSEHMDDSIEVISAAGSGTGSPRIIAME